MISSHDCERPIPNNKGVVFMSSAQWSALQNAAASSAMEGLPLERSHMEIIQSILDGKLSLQDYFRSLQERYQET